MKYDKLDAIVKNQLCIGCGFCQINLNQNHNTKLEYNHNTDSFSPELSSQNSNLIAGKDFICPGSKMDMVELSSLVHQQQPSDPILGVYKKLFVGYSENPAIRKSAASGGAIPALLSFLFNERLIDVAYCVNSESDPKSTKGYLLKSQDDIQKIHGSNYHPVNFGDCLNELVNSNLRFAFVGLPCEIAALEMLKQKLPTLKDQHVLSLGLFCGGINSFKGINYYLNQFKIDIQGAEKIDYRHGDWPGDIKISLKNKETKILPRIKGNSRWKILKYMMAFQGYWMLKRCRICPDQISDFADIALGDPHLPRFKKTKNDGWSIMIARTGRGLKCLEDAIDKKYLFAESISEAEVVQSQGYTLDNRRHVLAYLKVAKFLRMPTPEISVYEPLTQSVSFRHYVYAFVDLMKIKLEKRRFLKLFYLPWQIFEYLFITLTPNLIFKRLSKLIKNAVGE